MLRVCVHGLRYQSDERIFLYLDATRFRIAALIWMFQLRADLITTIVERWHLETHTFHLPCGECTITLEDVALQLGLLVDSDAVTSSSKMFKTAVLCYQLLRNSPSDGETRLTNLKFSWLKENFKTLLSSASEWEKMCATRAYILQLIGGTYAGQR
ncbi:hypothetical protein J1N35_000635 [Gossypium stocksii]|uniref:Aminotransferase-like plant mobile domain-containing protein n=1 Tax=Gossypium stocksii TaxID=47602 RepID=A0A9D4AK98_9ROSI|nr:hypothetical protein J1N35_000635 [Gossypium stocksii]